MAYNVVPTTPSAINTYLEKITLSDETKSDIKNLYTHVSKTYGIADPLALDSKGRVKIIRSLQYDANISDLKKQYGNVSMSFGNGSRGNSGSNNKGLHFEEVLYEDILKYKNGKKYQVKNKELLESITKYVKKVKDVSLDGALNQARPIVITEEGLTIKSPEDYNIGSLVTDITINDDTYLSLKYGSTVTFVNSGVKKFFNETDMKNGIVSAEGKSLLDMFGIEADKFCDVFNNYDLEKQRKDHKEVIEVEPVNPKVKEFMKSVIGQGYLLVHKSKKHSTVIDMTPKVLDKLTDYKSIKVSYPKDGSAKRVDVFLENDLMTIKVNIRNKCGDIYPSHIMADYKFKDYNRL